MCCIGILFKGGGMGKNIEIYVVINYIKKFVVNIRNWK